MHAANLRIKAETEPEAAENGADSLPDTPTMFSSTSASKPFAAPYVDDDDLDQMTQDLKSKLDVRESKETQDTKF